MCAIGMLEVSFLVAGIDIMIAEAILSNDLDVTVGHSLSTVCGVEGVFVL